MKRGIIIVLALVCVIGASIIGIVFWQTHQIYDVAQKRAAIGKDYMNSISPAEEEKILRMVLKLWSQEASNDYQIILSKDGPQKNLPDDWIARGLICIKASKDHAFFIWQGGPFAHTELIVKQETDHRVTLVGHFSNHEPEKLLKTIQPREWQRLKEPTH
jgi:hypothetical protein